MTDNGDPAYWDTEAAAFDEAADHGLRDPATREAWRRLLHAHLPPAPAAVVDLGCGTGTLSLLLAEDGYDVRGLDFSGAMVRAARAKAGERVAFAQGDASRPPYEPGSADVVLTRHVLWALPDPVDALRRWCELLRPSGRLLLVEGSWSTGAGLTAVETERLVRGHRASVRVHRLDDAALWGRPVDDERYLVLSER